MVALTWEKTTHTNFVPDKGFWDAPEAGLIMRAKVPGGWLLREECGKAGSHGPIVTLVYVPDPKHEWI